MRLLIYAFVGITALAYVSLAWEIFEQDRFARLETPLPTPRVPFAHPESNLRHLRDAFTTGDFSNDLAPFLEAARRKAPASYQSWFLTASYHARRADEPTRTEMAYAAAVRRFPANGRLRLGLAEWLLSPRSSLPYRTHALAETETQRTNRHHRALNHLQRALQLEPELLRAGVHVLSRFNVPLAQWSQYLPDNEASKREILVVLNRPARVADRRSYLSSLMAQDPLSASLLKDVVSYSSRWGENTLWTQAAERWLELAEGEARATDLSQAAGLLAQSFVVRRRPHEALAALRRGMGSLESRELSRTLGVDLLTRVATLLHDHHEFDLAQGLFVEALELAPRDMRARVGLARIYFRRGERVDALRQLRQVLELDPDHVQAVELMARISVGER